MAINLEKGQRINLKKENGSTLQNICVGINWGAIETQGFLGGRVSKEAVDLDASCALFNGAKQVDDVVYYGNLKSKDGAVKHSGDDLTGDLTGDDGFDNEVITLNLSSLNANIEYVAFVLNSFSEIVAPKTI